MPKIFVLSGEVSGDIYAGRLISELKRLSPDSEIYAMGGNYSYLAGAKVLADPTGIAVVGLVEVVKHLKEFRFIYNTIKNHILELRPDTIVFIDYPGFNLRLAKDLRKRLPNTKFVYYIAPQVWAWGRGRISLMRKVVDKLFVIFPFEEEFFRQNGIEAQFVGHPLAEVIKERKIDRAFLDKYHIPRGKPLILLLPGSRRQEIARHLPVMLKSVDKLKDEFSFCINRAGPIPEYLYKQYILDYNIPLIPPDDHSSSFYFSELAWVASGTAVVETMFHNKPMIVIYKISPLTYLLGRWLVRIKYVSMVNILADRQLVPELIQSKFSAANLIDWTTKISSDDSYRSRMLSGLRHIKDSLTVYSPSQIVAKSILS